MGKIKDFFENVLAWGFILLIIGGVFSCLEKHPPSEESTENLPFASPF